MPLSADIEQGRGSRAQKYAEETRARGKAALPGPQGPADAVTVDRAPTARTRAASAVLDRSRLPRHVGIIMDGNGRWAAQRKRPRSEGHMEGARAAKRVVQAAAEIGLEYLSLYAFSTENWTRAEGEVSYLMFIIGSRLKKEHDFYRKNRIRLVHSGDLSRLPADIAQEIRSVVEDTARYSGLTVNMAINYGGRGEIMRAFHRAMARGGDDALTEESFRAFLDRPEMPDPDLIIRSGNERRLSNFLLWESAYAELFFSPKLWPDWGAEDLVEALVDYGERTRRFGGGK
jgi:undecaprenyl diphosphate synthase